jgi:hypothetical protein
MLAMVLIKIPIKVLLQYSYSFYSPRKLGYSPLGVAFPHTHKEETLVVTKLTKCIYNVYTAY